MSEEQNMTDPDTPLFLVGDEHKVRIVQSKDGWHWKKGNEKRSEPYISEYTATVAARRALGHHPRRNYPRG
jgi:hypothetical protein